MFERIVVRAHSKEGRPWKKMDFHLVDLQEKSIEMEYIPSITNGVGNGTMVNFFDNIFVLGGFYGHKEESNKLDDHHFHLGASRHSITNNNWKSIYLPLNRTIPNPASISGKLYCFGSQCLRPESYYYGGVWNKLELPCELQGRFVSTPVITDIQKSRIIAHVPDLNQLYAFCPPKDYFSRGGSTGGTWTRIGFDIYSWSKVVGVVDDLICFHKCEFDNLLEVYDLSIHKWVQVVADLSRVEITVRDFDKLFTLPGGEGEGFMCLASWLPIRPVAINEPPSVHFLRFYLKRSPDPLVINLTALDYQSYSIPSAGSVSDFVMLQYS